MICIKKSLIFGIFLSAFFISFAEQKEQRPPNIIYINTDDWGIGKVPAYKMDPVSERMIKTPNLDRLRAEGMLFTRGYAGNAVCGPSRNSLLTGKHGGNATWRANAFRPKPGWEWPPKDPMLGEVARQSGYKTAAFGKISIGGTHTPEEITSTGWDTWMGYLGHVDCRSFYGDHIWINEEKVPIPENDPEKLKDHVPVLGDHGVFTEDLYTDTMIEFITENKDQPFFIYFASTVPHGDSHKIPLSGLWVPDIEGYDQYTELTEREQLYAALMTRHDRNVGRLMDTVTELGIAEDTIIIWTTDNGDEDSYYKRTKTWDGNGPFRQRKRSLYEGGIRVPLLAWWPGTIEAGTDSDLITTQYDLMPTLADIGDQPVTDAMDGISIFPTLKGEPSKQSKREFVYWEFYGKSPQQALHLGPNWKAYRSRDTQGKWELYDLSKDISETNDLASQHPEIIARVDEIAKKEHTPHPHGKWNPPQGGEQ